MAIADSTSEYFSINGSKSSSWSNDEKVLRPSRPELGAGLDRLNSTLLLFSASAILLNCLPVSAQDDFVSCCCLCLFSSELLLGSCAWSVFLCLFKSSTQLLSPCLVESVVSVEKSVTSGLFIKSIFLLIFLFCLKLVFFPRSVFCGWFWLSGAGRQEATRSGTTPDNFVEPTSLATIRSGTLWAISSLLFLSANFDIS